jgi:hypothetical protein
MNVVFLTIFPVPPPPRENEQKEKSKERFKPIIGEQGSFFQKK